MSTMFLRMIGTLLVRAGLIAGTHGVAMAGRVPIEGGDETTIGTDGGDASSRRT